MREIVTIIKSTKGFAEMNPREIWHYKDLFYFLAWRDIKVRYKQAAMGILGGGEIVYAMFVGCITGSDLRVQ